MQGAKWTRWLTPAVGLMLLLWLFGNLEAEKIWLNIKEASPLWFLVAISSAISTNLICAYRWNIIIKKLGHTFSYKTSVFLYGQGLAANSVLPGGVVGGDLWRAIQISSALARGHKKVGPASVFLDRASGFWGLGCVGLTFGLILMATQSPYSDSKVIWLPLLVALMALVVAAPFVLSVIALPTLGRALRQPRLRSLRPAFHLLFKIARSTTVLIQTLPYSLVAQALTQVALWSCLMAIGLYIDPLLLVTVGSVILVVSIIPTAIGGFGPRELGVVALLTPFGLPPEELVAGSILFGLTATIQGVLSLAFFGKTKVGDSMKPTTT